MKFERFMFLALIASLVLSMGLVVACGDDDDDDDDDTADDDSDDDADDDSGSGCEEALGDNVEMCFEEITTADVCAQEDADCWVACFEASEECGDWNDCLVADCGYAA
ncbi:MAG: hypothetical protein IT350_15705 [Deltaproteobacteria bacterium]|nr:hypothetical protein [Deltaproteobacteria bacterium]